MIDSDKAFEIGTNGLSITADNGDQELYLTSITGDPTGSSAPINSWIFRLDNQTIWYKFGVNNSDWRQIRADDIKFDPSTSSLTSNDVQSALVELDNEPFGKDFAVDMTQVITSNATNVFLEYSSLTFTVSNTATNKFRVNSDFLWTLNSTTQDFRARLYIDAVLVKEIQIEPSDAGTDQVHQNNILYYIDNLSIGSHTASLEFKPRLGAGTARISDNTIEVWRVS